MSYCVNCGVELHPGAKECPLCGTPVYNPKEIELPPETPFFPENREKIDPVSKKELALLLTAMFASVAACCGLLNLALRPDLGWWLYAAGAAGMLWLWFVPPLLWRKMPFLLRVGIDMGAVLLYVGVIAMASHGMQWYVKLAMPMLLSAGVLGLVVCGLLKKGHSMLTSAVLTLLGLGLLCGVIEFWVDRFLRGSWHPVWSLIVLAVCVGLSVPLIVVRRVPSMREEVRRRFHL